MVSTSSPGYLVWKEYSVNSQVVVPLSQIMVNISYFIFYLVAFLIHYFQETLEEYRLGTHF